jgi:predicted dehydrogenase
MKVVQVGVGKMGQSWLKVLAGSGDLELVGIVEPVDVLRNNAVRDSGLDPAAGFASLDDAIATATFDAAVVVTPPPTHRPIAEQLLKAGKHVLVEKPLATTMEDAQALVNIAAETGKTLMVAQNYRHFEGFATARSLIEAGRIGAVRSVALEFRRDARTMFGEGDFRYSMKHPLLVDMSIHHFDMIRALLGSDPARVYAQSWHVPDGNFQFDAAVSVLITMEDGVAVSYSGNWATHGEDTSWNGDWDIVGERGRILWSGGDWGNAEVSIQEWGREPERVDLVSLARTGPEGLIGAFLAAIETGTAPETSAADNIRSLGIVLAAVESVETGKVVTFS